MNFTSFSGKLFLTLGALFVTSVLVLMLLPNESETELETANDGLRTRVYRASPDEVFAKSEEVVRSLEGWSVIQSAPEEKELSAQYTTGVFHFVSDVEISIQEGGNEKESEVDVTSTWHIGLYDFGTNSRIIEEFLTTLDRKLQRVQ